MGEKIELITSTHLEQLGFKELDIEEGSWVIPVWHSSEYDLWYTFINGDDVENISKQTIFKLNLNRLEAA